jgi:hypothetical protein
MADLEVHIDLEGHTRPVGLARSNRVRGAETILFEYAPAWLNASERFSLEPALALTRGAFAPPAGLATFGSIGDSAPDTWGRRLMQRAERRPAEREKRNVRTGDLAQRGPEHECPRRRDRSHGQRLRARRSRAGARAMTRACSSASTHGRWIADLQSS